MKRSAQAWFSFKKLAYLSYVAPIIRLVKNWPAFLLNYLGIRNAGGTYVFRNGVRITDKEGLATGTIAVVFLRKHYGEFRDRRVIVDIGANIGVFAVYAARQCPEASIYCYEPVKRNFELLVGNIGDNGLTEQVRTLNCAVAATAERRWITTAASPLGSLAESGKTAREDEGEEVECLTLRDVLERHEIAQVDLLKMNCEGAEYEIFYTADDDSLKRIRELRMEYHNGPGAERDNVDALQEFLQSNGFRVTKVDRYSDEDGFLWAERTAAPTDETNA